MATLTAKKNSLPGNSNGWENRHDDAVASASQDWNQEPFDSAMARMLEGWGQYAADHKERYETPIGEDYVLGPAWQRVGEAIRELLNGELGRLDGGTVDSFLLTTMSENGINTENL